MKMENGVVVAPDGFTVIPGCDGRYSIDCDGRVFSHARKRLLSICATNTGYLSVGIYSSSTGKSEKTLIQYLMVATFIPEWPVGAWVDHKNRCRSCNRVDNLRPANRREQCQNKVGVKIKNKTIYRGVILKNRNKFCWVATARTGVGRKKKWSKYFQTDKEAALEYDKMAIEFHGEFAITNKSLGLL